MGSRLRSIESGFAAALPQIPPKGTTYPLGPVDPVVRDIPFFQALLAEFELAFWAVDMEASSFTNKGHIALGAAP